MRFILTLFVITLNIFFSSAFADNNKTKVEIQKNKQKLELYSPKPIPEITFIDLAKKEYFLEDFENNLLFVNFWATWCLPCRTEMKDLDKLQKNYRKKPFKIIPIAEGSVNLDKDLDQLKEFYKSNEIKHLNYYFDAQGDGKKRGLFEYFSIISLPTTIMIDKAGNEIGRINGVIDLDDENMINLIENYIAE